MKKVSKYLSPKVIKRIRQEIQDSDRNEVFFVGKLDDNQIVDTIDVVARGNNLSVPIISDYNLEINVVIHNHPSGILHPSQNDIKIASQLERSGIVSYIINNDVTDIYAIYEPKMIFSKKDIDVDELVNYLEPDGTIAQKLQGFEYREQQIEMLKHVATAFNQDEIKVIEAGTGVGKSIAYLIPAIYWSIQNKERCVISTNTINLQEQLLKKDIPFLKSVLNVTFKAVLIKGRNNYLCMRKLKKVENEGDLLIEASERKEIDTIVAWSKKTKDGSKSDLNFIPKISIWEKVTSDSDTCLHSKCEFYHDCFVNKARKDANDANILIVNHYLLFADLAMKGLGSDIGILPQYRRLVIDEAHHLEDVATSNFGTGFTKFGMLKIVSKLYRHDKTKREKGLYIHLKYELTKFNIDKNLTEIDRLMDSLNKVCIADAIDLHQMISMTLNDIYDFVSSNYKNSFGELKLRILQDSGINTDWKTRVLESLENLIKKTTTYIKDVKSILDKVKIKSKKINETVFDIKVEINRLGSMLGTLEAIFFNNDDGYVRWIELNTFSNHKIIRFKISPLDISMKMRDLVYDIYPTVIMTSATISVNECPDVGGFEYFKKRTGLHLIQEGRIDYIKLSSGFDYTSQVILGIPSDIPMPGEGGFSDEICDVIMESVKISNGKAFVLFTSYGLLNLIYSRLEPFIVQAGFHVLKQGLESRHVLIERFKERNSSVLFGTDSFWEGVDVKGDALELVIITKLPFRVPTEPIIAARMEQIDREGGDSFKEYSLPEAIIKLKQGFGRLIRSKTDRGAILILDKRIVKKYYGKYFISSLPDCKIVKGEASLVLESMNKFYNGKRRKST